jgi:hypothetical protein
MPSWLPLFLGFWFLLSAFALMALTVWWERPWVARERRRTDEQAEEQGPIWGWYGWFVRSRSRTAGLGAFCAALAIVLLWRAT